MRRATVTAAIALVLVTATGCNAEEPLENWKKTQHFERAVSDTSLARMLEQLSQQTITDMVMSPDGPVEAVAHAGFTAEDSDALIVAGFAPYALRISEFAHRTIADALPQKDIDALFATGTDPGSIEAVLCAYGRPPVDGRVDWEGCSAQGFVELPESFKNAHERYTAAYQAVIDSPRTQTYFGGVSCRVLDQIAARLTTGPYSVDFNGTTLGMIGQEKQDCPTLKAALDALDRETVGG